MGGSVSGQRVMGQLATLVYGLWPTSELSRPGKPACFRRWQVCLSVSLSFYIYIYIYTYIYIFRGVARMLKLLSPIDYCQGIRRERGTLLLVLFLVQHEIYADIDVSLKYHDEHLTLDVSRAAFGRQQSNPRQSILYTGFLDLGLRRTLPSSACLAVLGVVMVTSLSRLTGGSAVQALYKLSL